MVVVFYIARASACLSPALVMLQGIVGEPDQTGTPEATGGTGGGDTRRMTLSRYLEVRAAEGGHSTIPFSNALRPLMSPAVRLRAKQMATAAVAPRARRQARSFEGARPLRLHLGSGGNNLDGWINIDLVGAHADLAWDLRRPLPLGRGTAEAVFLEHVLEHMTIAEGVSVLHHFLAVLVPGGILRVGVPDAGLYATSYVHEDAVLDELRPGRPTRMLALGEVFQEHGHVSAWDGETLCLAVSEAGYRSATVMPGGTSKISPAPDSEARIPETVYVEAVAPS
jgi:predicted SAM-dependent methyltransferase